MSNRFKGLNSKEVEESINKNGSNKLSEFKSETLLEKFIGNFNDPIIKILCVAWLVLLGTAIIGKSEIYEAIGLAIAIILATFVGAFTEYQSGNVFAKLQESASKILCKVYREGNVVELSIDDIVVGDEIILQTGDKIPADGILLEGLLRVDQSTLNGESVEAKKEVLPESIVSEGIDTHNKYQVFRETVVTSGEAVMKVTTVGASTEYGKIHEGLSEDNGDSPLKEKLTVLAHQISKLGYTSGVLVILSIMVKNMFLSGVSTYFNDMGQVGVDLLEAIIVGIIIIVVAVPEGLPLMIAMVLSLNSKKMYKDNILVRKNIGIETAGSLNILFTDKTGTITRGKLEATSLINGDIRQFEKFNTIPEKLRSVVFKAILRNTTSVISKTDEGIQILGGNATEKAVLGYVGEEDNSLCDVIIRTPFSSTYKFSSTTIVENGEKKTLIKGAPEKILSKCNNYYSEDGTVKKFDKHKELDNLMNDFAKKMYRLLVLATCDTEIKEGEDLSDNLTLVGLLTIRDSVRPEAITAIKEAQSAGVQVVMITGDRKETAIAIAKESGIIENEGDIALTSQRLNEMSDEEVKNNLPKIKVIARALPTDKSRLVRLSQELNLVVGMTGDGVNDSPALKLADVGFAMGSGTEVAKEAGEIIIVDDNFNSIAKTILYGRTIYRSIQKFIVFQLSINVSALLISIIAPLIGLEIPLTVIQMLWVNLVMDTLAAIAFGSEPVKKHYMKEKPKDRGERIVTKNMATSILTSGVVLTGLGLWFLMGTTVENIFKDTISLQTGYFTFFVLFSVINGLNVRTEKINIFSDVLENKAFLGIMGLIIAIQVLITFVGGEVLRVTPLNIREWSFVLGLSLVSLIVGLLRKLIVGEKN